jgi:NhaP-type Na+/H+ or K+/H+ antiporter
VAAVVGYLIFSAYFAFVIAPLITPAITAAQAATYLLTNGLVQAGIGALAGFYGGYLRRRMADPNARQQSAARRRR